MKRGLAGKWEFISLEGTKVRAFIPAPLPPYPPLDLSPMRQQRIERTLLALGRLDAIASLLPEPEIFLYAYIRREAVLSSQIEGTQSSLSDLLLFELDQAPGVPFDDVVEVSNYVAALEHGMARLAEGFPLCNRLIRELHAKLLASGRGANKAPGEFRTTQNWIGGTHPNNAVFVPPPPQEVERCMSELESFIHASESPGALIKAALAHVQFETIHPFLDGNGRVGRLLIAFILHHEGVLRQPLLYLSLYFKRYRSEYYRLLDIVRQTGDWEAWLDFFLEGVTVTAQDAVDTAHRLLTLFTKDREQIVQLGRLAPNALRAFDILRHRPVINIKSLAHQAKMNFTTAARAIEALEKLGIVREVTGRERERIFVYGGYLDLLMQVGVGE